MFGSCFCFLYPHTHHLFASLPYCRHIFFSPGCNLYRYVCTIMCSVVNFALFMFPFFVKNVNDRASVLWVTNESNKYQIICFGQKNSTSYQSHLMDFSFAVHFFCFLKKKPCPELGCVIKISTHSQIAITLLRLLYTAAKRLVACK